MSSLNWTVTALLAFGVSACGDDDVAGDGETGDSTSTGGTMTTMQPDTGTPAEDTVDPDPDPTGDTADSDSTAAADSTSGDGESSSTGVTGDLDAEIQFAVRVGDTDAACGMTYDNVGSSDATIGFFDLRFYVSNVRLVDGDGAQTPLVLTDDDEWQSETIALLDFEDGTGDCSENTTAETNTVLAGTVPAGEYTGIRFDLGIPFDENHLNADEADPPLNQTAMFWNWAAGYKFVKIDLVNENAAPANRWNFHLGSQACDNAMGGPTVPPDEECGRPGRPAIAVDGFDPLTGTVVLDIAALLSGVDVNVDTMDTAPGCMSFMPDVNECEDLYPNLGLDWTSGDCEGGCAGQTAFSGE